MIMFDREFPANWYWIVNGSTTFVYSSKTGTYIPVDDVNYVAWVGDGHNPTRIANETELGEVLAQHNLRPTTPTVLDAFLLAKISATDQIQFRILFNHENRIRVLEGKQPVTAVQFINAIKALL